MLANEEIETGKKIIPMKNRKRQNTELDASKPKELSIFQRIIEHPLGSTVIGGLIVAIISIVASAITSALIQSNLMQSEITGMQSDIAEIKESVAVIPEMKESMGRLDERVGNLEEKVGKLEERMDSVDRDIDTLNSKIATLNGKIAAYHGIDAISLQLTEKAQDSLELVSNNTDTRLLTSPTWQDDEVIATSLDSSVQYTAEQLTNQKLLIPYTEDGKEIIFYGQFNENNHWDGNCIINTYNEGTLVFVMDAEYNDGELISYKQISPDTTLANKNVWIVSDRQVQQNSNVGNTWSYIRETDITKDFEQSEVTVQNIIAFDSFVSTLTTLEGFYHGQTSNGYYNDNTGEAYLVKYADDGTVRTLYQGNFSNGAFEDDTNNAWYITRSDDTDYMYYKGEFKNQHPVNNTGSIFTNPISLDEIASVINQHTFDCELIWHTSDGKITIL